MKSHISKKLLLEGSKYSSEIKDLFVEAANAIDELNDRLAQRTAAFLAQHVPRKKEEHGSFDFSSFNQEDIDLMNAASKGAAMSILHEELEKDRWRNLEETPKWEDQDGLGHVSVICKHNGSRWLSTARISTYPWKDSLITKWRPANLPE